MSRPDGRAPDQLRPVSIERGYLRTCPGSVRYRCGGTTVLVTAQVADDVPPFLVGKGTGWLTAEYNMLPGSTPTRKRRGPDGRATEIQRLIGRSLRAVLDFTALGPWSIHVDADVMEADGGTRTAAITAGFIAVVDALRSKFGDESRRMLRDSVAAVSVGMLGGQPVLDLDYAEDSTADVDLNVVTLGSGGLVEVQGTGERGTFTRPELLALLDLAQVGVDQLTQLQQTTLGGDWPQADQEWEPTFLG